MDLIHSIIGYSARSLEHLLTDHQTAAMQRQDDYDPSLLIGATHDAGIHVDRINVVDTHNSTPTTAETEHQTQQLLESFLAEQEQHQQRHHQHYQQQLNRNEQYQHQQVLEISASGSASAPAAFDNSRNDLLQPEMLLAAAADGSGGASVAAPPMGRRKGTKASQSAKPAKPREPKKPRARKQDKASTKPAAEKKANGQQAVVPVVEAAPQLVPVVEAAPQLSPVVEAPPHLHTHPLLPSSQLHSPSLLPSPPGELDDSDFEPIDETLENEATSSQTAQTVEKQWVKRFFCDYPGCEGGFTTPAHLGRHHRTQHLGVRPYTCPLAKENLCDKTFPRKDNMQVHSRSCARKKGFTIDGDGNAVRIPYHYPHPNVNYPSPRRLAGRSGGRRKNAEKCSSPIAGPSTVVPAQPLPHHVHQQQVAAPMTQQQTHQQTQHQQQVAAPMLQQQTRHQQQVAAPMMQQQTHHQQYATQVHYAAAPQHFSNGFDMARIQQQHQAQFAPVRYAPFTPADIAAAAAAQAAAMAARGSSKRKRREAVHPDFDLDSQPKKRCFGTDVDFADEDIAQFLTEY
ncbi:hypothetical protein DFJ77DRAFT_454103 [Powellomyces hirtus]|nr:hypothetical protein DFJ77DRAFT_454103 [Powellomyces hirtus]